MDILGIVPQGHERRLGGARRGATSVVIRLKTKDSQFVSVNLNAIFVVPKHIFSRVADIDKFVNSNPVGSGPFVRVSRFNAQDYVLEPATRGTGRRASRSSVHRVHPRPRRTTPRCSQIVGGKADWTHNFVPNVEKAYIAEGPSLLPRVLRHDRVPDLVDVRHGQVPVQHHRVPQGGQPWRSTAQKVSKLGEYGYAPPTDAIGLSQPVPQLGEATRRSRPTRRRSLAYNPNAAKRML